MAKYQRKYYNIQNPNFSQTKHSLREMVKGTSDTQYGPAAISLCFSYIFSDFTSALVEQD